MKVVFVTPIPPSSKPTDKYIESMEASIPLIRDAGIEEKSAYRNGPYISWNRNDAIRAALDEKPDVIACIDYDLSWKPRDLLTLLTSPGDFVGGTYRYKKDEEEYMGAIEVNDRDRPIVRWDGAIKAHSLPAGFLKLTVNAIRKMMRAYPELLYGDPERPSFDLFNHGAHKWSWYGEDMALCRRWREIREEIWCLPNLDLTHWHGDKAFPGNFHNYLLCCPGGSRSIGERNALSRDNRQSDPCAEAGCGVLAGNCCQ